MTTEQAMKIIEDVTGNISASRQTHATIAQAIKAIQEALAKKSLKTEKTEKTN